MMKFLILLIFSLHFAGISCAQKLNFEYITVKDGLPQSTVKSIVKDNLGFMWFGTWNGLARYDGYKFKVYRSIPGDKTSLGNSRIHNIYKDHSGTLWVTTFNDFVCKYDYIHDNFVRYRTAQLSKSLQDSTSRLKSFQSLMQKKDFLRKKLGSFSISLTGEHFVFDQKNHDGGLNDGNVNCIYIDGSNILWIGTVSGGINKANLGVTSFKHFAAGDLKHSPVTNAVTSLVADSNRLWLGTQYDGVYYMDQEGHTIKHFSDELYDRSVKSIFKDKRGNTWIGCRTSLSRVGYASFKPKNYFNRNVSLSPSRFFAIAESPLDHSVYIATSNGLLRYNDNKDNFENIDLGKYYKPSAAGCLFFDSANTLWLGAENTGLIKLTRNTNTGKWIPDELYSSESKGRQLPDNRVYSIDEDEYGDIWVGTANGLCRLHQGKGRPTIYGQNAGLSDQYVTKLFADKSGSVWIAHKSGLSRIMLHDSAVKNYSIFGNAESYEFVDGSGYRDSKMNRIYLGELDGYVTFNPATVVSNPYIPPLVLTELQVLNKTVRPGETVNGQVVLKSAIEKTDQITLQHADRSFSVEFAALYFSNPAKNRYRYMLEGSDKNWIETDATRRIASYSNLIPGTYLFMVNGSNPDGTWSKNPRKLRVTILPPWWMTWWAYLIYILIITGVVYLIYRIIRTRTVYRRNLLTEKLRAEKAFELEQVRLKYFTYISHELRTPITLIVDPLETLVKGDIDQANLQYYLGIMRKNAQRLLQLVNQFLDLRKIEFERISLRPVKSDVICFVRTVMDAFAHQAEQKKINFELIHEDLPIHFSFDPDILEKVLFNLLSNAFKYTTDGGHIKVKVKIKSLEDMPLFIQVVDNGIGIPKELQEQIFEPFYRIKDDNHENVTGSGVGLALTKELVIIHNGLITVSSDPSEGTCFEVRLPETSLFDSKSDDSESGKNVNDQDTSASKKTEVDSMIESLPVVLIVEDNSDVRSYLKKVLGDDFKIYLAADGIQGGKLAEDLIPDLVISDVMMPGKDGLTLCSEIKSDIKTSHIPVILLTARQSDTYQIQGYQRGADAYVSKPFSSEVLMARVKGLIESRLQLRKLFQSAFPGELKSAGFSEVDQAFLEKATNLIKGNLSNNTLDVEWLASQMFLSRTQFYRKIKALTDQSAQDFLATVRLTCAAEMLVQKGMSVAEVSFKTGYADPTSFSRAFQRKYKMSPKQYSQQEKTTDV